MPPRAKKSSNKVDPVVDVDVEDVDHDDTDTDTDTPTTKKQKTSKTSVTKVKQAKSPKSKSKKTTSPKKTSPKAASKAASKGKRKKQEEQEDEDEEEEATKVTETITKTKVEESDTEMKVSVTEETKTTTPTTIHTIPSTSPIKTILSWNVNGIRAAMKKGAIDYLKKQNADVVCLSEIKVDTAAQAGVGPIYPHMYWNPCTAQKGYSGTALFSKVKPIKVTYGMGIKKHDNEGRIITAEFEPFYLVNTYVPNAGQKLDRLSYRTTEWDIDMFAYLHTLQKAKPVIWTGDLNVAHLEIDIHNPKTNKKSAGFTKEERESFSSLLKGGFIDVYRHLYPTAVGYTYWSHKFSGREKNLGWRLDYYVISPSLVPLVSDVIIESELTADKSRRSDHAPLLLKLK